MKKRLAKKWNKRYGYAPENSPFKSMTIYGQKFPGWGGMPNQKTEGVSLFATAHPVTAANRPSVDADLSISAYEDMQDRRVLGGE